MRMNPDGLTDRKAVEGPAISVGAEGAERSC